MNLQRRFSLKTQIALILLAIPFCVYVPVNAQQAGQIVSDHFWDVYITPEGDAEVNYQLQLNNQSEELIDQLTGFVPYPGATLFQLTGNVADNVMSTEPTADGVNWRIKMQNSVVWPGGSREFNFSFRIPQVLKHYWGYTQLHLPIMQTDYTLASWRLRIANKANRAEELMYVSSFNTSGDQDYLELFPKKDLVVVWGSSINLLMEHKITVQPTEGMSSLVNMLPMRLWQVVDYLELDAKQVDFYQDAHNNTWASLDAGKDIRYVAQIQLTGSSGPELDPDINKFYRELVQNKQPIINNEIDFSRIGDIVSSSALTPKLTQLGFAIAMRDELISRGHSAEIVYGYLLAPFVPTLDRNTPRIWVEADIEGQRVNFDPYLEALSDYNFLNFDSRTRLVVGTWDQNQPLDSLLGLMGNSPSQLDVAGIGELAEWSPIPPGNWESSLIAPEFAYSGEPFSLQLKLVNSTSKFIALTNLDLNGSQISLNQSLPFGFIPTAAPITVSGFQLASVRESDFLFQGQKDYTLTITTDNLPDNIRIARTAVSLFQDTKLLVGALVLVLIVCIALTGVLIKQLRIWRRMRLYVSINT